MAFRAFATVVVDALEAGAGSYPVAVLADLAASVVLGTIKTIFIMARFAPPGDSETVPIAAAFAFLLGLGAEDTVFVSAWGDYD